MLAPTLDFYLSSAGDVGIGGGGYSATNVVVPNTWNRILFVADLAANRLTYYVNGVNVKSRGADGLGGRWSVYSNEEDGADLLLFNEGDTSGLYTHELYVNSIAFTDRALSDNEAAALGGPAAAGILAPSFVPAPKATIQTTGSNVAISWPTNVVGYALEQSASLNPPHWLPVWAVTNSSVTLPTATSDRYFRLVQ
jgi:hypothetical protein